MFSSEGPHGCKGHGRRAKGSEKVPVLFGEVSAIDAVLGLIAPPPLSFSLFPSSLDGLGIISVIALLHFLCFRSCFRGLKTSTGWHLGRSIGKPVAVVDVQPTYADV